MQVRNQRTQYEEAIYDALLHRKDALAHVIHGLKILGMRLHSAALDLSFLCAMIQRLVRTLLSLTRLRLVLSFYRVKHLSLPG